MRVPFLRGNGRWIFIVGTFENRTNIKLKHLKRCHVITKRKQQEKIGKIILFSICVCVCVS